MPLRYVRKTILASSTFLVILVLFLYFMWSLTPALGAREKEPFAETSFVVRQGEGFFLIADRLREEGLIRSGASFKILALSLGKARRLKPGHYALRPSMSSMEILNLLAEESRREVSVTVREGETLYEIDRLLAEKRIITRGDLVTAGESRKLEGYLFPDTYHFFTDSSVEEVFEIFLKNFQSKTKLLLAQISEERTKEILILASLLEREVPDFEERKLVAGVLKKRLVAGVPLQVDAAICYIKEMRAPKENIACYPLAPLDFRVDSPYNTYIYKGLPPGPIGNPGLSAIEAALSPRSSENWFYLSDPATGKTIFAKTLDEHSRNRVKYLKAQ